MPSSWSTLTSSASFSVSSELVLTFSLLVLASHTDSVRSRSQSGYPNRKVNTLFSLSLNQLLVIKQVPKGCGALYLCPYTCDFHEGSCGFSNCFSCIWHVGRSILAQKDITIWLIATMILWAYEFSPFAPLQKMVVHKRYVFLVQAPHPLCF